MSARATTTGVSVPQARDLVKDLFEPRAGVYWADFLVSLAIGVAGFQVARHARSVAVRLGLESAAAGWAVAGLAFAVSCLALYRATMFTHELVHVPRGRLRGFRVAWNLLAGIPFLMPSFLYESHLAHHRASEYGSRGDGEYLPWARMPARAILLHLAQNLLVPGLAVGRFLVLGPLSWVSPRVAGVVHRRASALVVNPRFQRPPPTRQELRLWRLQEAGCLVVLLALAGSIGAGIESAGFLAQAYLTGVATLTINSVRTLGAHRYRHGEGGLSPLEQVLDSVNYPRAAWLSSLWGPLGLRFHALHHLFPSLPYHALGEAHRRLMAQLPPDSPYRLTESPGLWWSLRRLWHEARASA